MSQKDIPVAVVKRARLLARRIKRERGAGRSSARGVIVLFSGASGPRSTTAAEVLANELGLDLCRVDLGAVVSKYIGETEKNLKRLFDAVDVSDMIFFFDEADALFGEHVPRLVEIASGSHTTLDNSLCCVNLFR